MSRTRRIIAAIAARIGVGGMVLIDYVPIAVLFLKLTGRV
jgi:hypothetical protein